MDTQHPAKGGQTKLVDVIGNESVLGLYALAKYAAAFFMDVALLCHPLKLGLQAPDLGTLIHLRALNDLRLGKYLLPGIEAVARDAQPLGHFGHGPSVLGYLPHRFDLELIRISFASHKDLIGCHKLWLQVVYESLGGPGFAEP
jgi:hypothetical protein